jgi:hypothetical protein
MEFTIQDKTYRAKKLNAMKQFHIVRRLVPLIGNFAPALKEMPMIDGKPDMTKLKDIDVGKILPAITSAISSVSDEDADFCIHGLLSVVQKKGDKDEGWFDVCVNGGMMFEDMTLATILQLAFKSLTHNLSDFFQELPSALNADNQKQKSQSNG